MIVHDFPLPEKQVRIDIHKFCLILVLVIPDFGFVVFFLIWDFIFFLRCYKDFLQINCVSEGLKKTKNFWASVQAEAGDTAQDTSYMPPALKMPYHKGKFQYSLRLCYRYITLPWWKLKRYASHGGLFWINFGYTFFFTCKCRKYLSKFSSPPLVSVISNSISKQDNFCCPQ